MTLSLIRRLAVLFSIGVICIAVGLILLVSHSGTKTIVKNPTVNPTTVVSPIIKPPPVVVSPQPELPPKVYVTTKPGGVQVIVISPRPNPTSSPSPTPTPIRTPSPRPRQLCVDKICVNRIGTADDKISSKPRTSCLVNFIRSSNSDCDWDINPSLRCGNMDNLNNCINRGGD